MKELRQTSWLSNRPLCEGVAEWRAAVLTTARAHIEHGGHR